jgi:hypothetical protein
MHTETTFHIEVTVDGDISFPDDAPRPSYFDADNWRRLPEVVNYAAAHGISVPDAIVRLVNAGLSHESKVNL